MQIGLNNSIFETFKQTVTQNGFSGYSFLLIIITCLSNKGFYFGLGSTLMRDIPFSCVQFTVYEYLRKISLEKNNGSPLTIAQIAINGLFSSALGI